MMKKKNPFFISFHFRLVLLGSVFIVGKLIANHYLLELQFRQLHSKRLIDCFPSL
jgi:hypothetical protein